MFWDLAHFALLCKKAVGSILNVRHVNVPCLRISYQTIDSSLLKLSLILSPEKFTEPSLNFPELTSPGIDLHYVFFWNVKHAVHASKKLIKLFFYFFL